MKNSAQAETRLAVRVQPGARTSEVVGFRGDVLWVRVAAPPHEGKANKALVQLLAEKLDVPPSRITIVRGRGSRQKLVSVQGRAPEAVRTALSG